MRPLPTLTLAALFLTAVPAAARWGPDVVPLALPSGSLDVEVILDNGRNLPFDRAGGDRYKYQGATSDLVGRPYSIHLRNRTDERLKVVVAVDGVNVYWKAPLRGTADGDVGSILRPGERRELEGFQVDENTAQRFVFSPPEWSEGSERAETRIGTIEVHVYREWHPIYRREAPAGEMEKHGAQAPALQAAPGEPPIGTTGGEDVESNVRRVRFVCATPTPESRALLIYGRPDETRPVPGPWYGSRLGIRGEDTEDGIRIVEVLRGTLAEDAGLLRGDVIVKVDVTPEPRLADLRRALERKHSGEYLFLEIARRSHTLSLKLRLD